MNEQQVKKPYQSKTILLNAIIGLAGVVAMFVPQAAGIKTFIDGNAVMIGAIWSVLNIVLRSISKDKIVLTD